MQRNHEPSLQPPGGTGRTQNQRNHGNDGDALERDAIAEIRRAEGPRHTSGNHNDIMTSSPHTGPENKRDTWNTIERLLGECAIIKNDKLGTNIA